MAAEQNRYNSVPRKIFDKHVDTIERKRQRDKQDHRSDLITILKRIGELELTLAELNQELDEMQAHIGRHCGQLDASRVNGSGEPT